MESITIDIAVSPERVWEVMSDFENWPKWTASVKSIKRLDSGPPRVGSRVVIRQPKFPPAVWKMVELAEPPFHLAKWLSRNVGVRHSYHRWQGDW